MSENRSLQEFRDYYNRWAPSVLTYCQLFLGTADQAEEATAEAFSGFFLGWNGVAGSRLAVSSATPPVVLLRQTVRTVSGKCSLKPARAESHPELEEALALLPCEQRSVFILRGALQFTAADTAAITGLTTDRINQLWGQALMVLRQLWDRKGAR